LHATAKDRHSLAAICSQKGGRTGSGELFSPSKLPPAHRSLPFGTFVHVTNLKNRRTVIVRINDRGPFNKGQIIDLSPGAARQFGFSGVVPVTLDVVAAPQWGEAAGTYYSIGARFQARESRDSPRLNAFCRVAPSVRFSVLAIVAAPVFFRASAFKVRT